MSNFFEFGPTGHGLALDASGRVATQDGPPTGAYVFGYGSTGHPLLVDSQGRLLISMQTASGILLPDPSIYTYGDKFYVTGSGANNPGFYLRGTSNWEAITVASPSGEANTASNSPGGVGVFAFKVGFDLRFKSLIAGSGIQFIASSNNIRIDNKNTRGLDISLVDVGNYYPTNNVESAPQVAGLKNKNFSDASGSYVKSASNAGGISVIKTGNAPVLSLKGLTTTSGLGLVVGANTITIGKHLPSGETLPPFLSSQFGDEYYHHGSGYYKRGQFEWELQTVAIPHGVQWWQDTTPAAGLPFSLPIANTYVRFSSISASGGVQTTHGIQATTSGIKILDDESAGKFLASWNVSYEGNVNTIYYGSLFKNSTRLRESTSVNRLGNTSDYRVIGSRAIIDLDKNDELTLRFAAGANNKTMSIFTMNISLARIVAKNQILAP